MSKPIVEITLDTKYKEKNNVLINGIELKHCIKHIGINWDADEHYPTITLKFKANLKFNYKNLN